MSNREVLVAVENVSKKFCRDLKRSLWYGMKDLTTELRGRSSRYSELREDEFWALKDVSLKVCRGEHLGLVGQNGAGKSTLLKLLNGLMKPDRGRIMVRGRVGALIALGAGFNPILTGRENIYINSAVLGLSKREVDKVFDDIIDFADISDFIDTPVGYYSSGMHVRLGFAVAAHTNPDVLLVDEVLAVGDEGFQGKCLNKIGNLREKGTATILVSHNMHTISTFANRVILMNNGEHEKFDNVSEAIKAYRELFREKDDFDTQEISSGNEVITFYRVDINKRSFLPGDTLSLSLKYESAKEYPEAEIDVAIYSSNEPSLHFQATNKAYNKEINLSKGQNELTIKIKDVRINDAIGRIAIAIWAMNRTELLFWWRIPVTFGGVPHSTGNSFLPVVFELK